MTPGVGRVSINDMENSRRFLANFSPYASTRHARTPHGPQLSRFGSNANASRNVTQQRSPYFAQSAPVETPMFERQSPEIERPLDDFDKELLRESHIDHRIPERSGLPRVSLPPKPLTPLMSSSTRTFIQDDLHDNTMFQPSSSSPTALVTSPTVSVLQNRQRDRAKLSLQNNMINSTLENLPSQEFGSAADASTVINRNAKQKVSQAKPPSETPPVIQGIQLVPTTALPDQLRSVFKFDIFNAVQSKCFASAFKSDDNIVVSAPTGSGKTAVMELAICRLVAESRGQDFKVVYQAPTKSLCAERHDDWQKKFNVLNLGCAELTGDTDFGYLRNVQKASIIITTPEKWDSVTRKWKDHAKLMQLVKLFLVDEVHILKDERGATLEAVVSRMKSVVSDIRFVALSATVPNSEDIAMWLGKDSTTQHLPAHREVFGESFRPVQLKKHVYGFEAKGNDFAFEAMLTQQIPNVIEKHGRGKPVMVFCSTRRASVATAQMLAEMWSSSHPLQRLWKGPDKQLSLTSPELKTTCVAGVAFHHGGVSVSDRRTVEQAFLNGQINIICSTSTLAVGVNLPCYLVILKGTCAWSDNGLKEYADLEVMQMLGRAGRPQFETSACAVILARREKVTRYEKMVSGEELLESCLHQNLIEHLNAEIVLGTIHDVATAKQWLASTFFYVRLKKNPPHYQFRGVGDNTEDELLEQLCKNDIDLLLDAGLVEQRARLASTMFGEAMARYYVTFDTMKSFMGLPPKAKMSEILSLLAQAREFRDVRMLAGEKSFYKEINKAPEIKFPIKVDIALPAQKISLLLQAELGNVVLPDGENHKKHHQQYRIDRTTVFVHANRLVRCLIDCQIQLEDAISARHALELGRSLAAHVWDNTASQLRQVEGLGEVAVRKLASASINSIDTLLNTESSRIELVLGKNPPFGHQLLKKLESFPNLRVSVKETGRNIRVGKGATIKMVAEIDFLNEVPPQIFNKKPFSVCFLAEDSHGSLVDFRRFSPKKLGGGEQVYLTLRLTKPTSHVNCYVMCDDIAGTSKYAELNLSGVPVSIYPTERARDDSSDDSSNRARDDQGPRRCDDEFDDGGINDQDLLAVEADGTKIEVIEDIDAILETEDKKRPRLPKQEHDEDADISVYREPTQLPNGRWTCQHDCYEREKKCKHKCCKEGVSKPKRRPKAESKIKDEENGQKKITAMAMMKPKVKSIEEPPGVRKETKIQPKSSRVPATDSKDRRHGKRTGNFEELHRARSRSSSEATSVHHKKHSYEPAAKRSKPLANQERNYLDQNETDLGPDSKHSHDRQASPEIHDTNVAGAKDDLFPQFDEDDFFDFSFEDPGTLNDHRLATEVALPFVDRTNPTDLSVRKKEWTRPDEDNFDFVTSDIDLGGFNPPSEHVAMSDLLKKSKSPSGDQSSTGAQTPLEDKMDIEEDFFGTPTDVIGRQMDQAEQDGDAFRIQNQDVDPGADAPTESSVKTPQDLELSSTAQENGNVEADMLCKETDADRRKRLYEEDQKKKWEGIDQWIYDEFHKYVELV